MERRRSTRGRPPTTASTSIERHKAAINKWVEQAPSNGAESSIFMPSAPVRVPPPRVSEVSSTPDVGREEVLNSRGIPARTRTPSRLYFDKNMVTTLPQNWKVAHAQNKRMLKTESNLHLGPRSNKKELPKAGMRDLAPTGVSNTKKKKRQSEKVHQESLSAKKKKRGVSRGSETPSEPNPGISKVYGTPVTPVVKPIPIVPTGYIQFNDEKYGRTQTKKTKSKPAKKATGQTPFSEVFNLTSSIQQSVQNSHVETLTWEPSQEDISEGGLGKKLESCQLDNRPTLLPPVPKVESKHVVVVRQQRTNRQNSKTPHLLYAGGMPNNIVPKREDSCPTQAIARATMVARQRAAELRNVLKLPKAYKWVLFEWFYSNIDRALFGQDNDFQICLKQFFPKLKTRQLKRAEWTKIRRLLGKPRRCSSAFFSEERAELAQLRARVWQLQQRKAFDFELNSKELPSEIPQQLVIGTKVTAWARTPRLEGIFLGTIQGVDTSNKTYRIEFDRPGLGTFSIPEHEVFSNEPPETIPVSIFTLQTARRGAGSGASFIFQNLALLQDQPEGFPTSNIPPDFMIGGFPGRFLNMIVQFAKLLKAKREKLVDLRELNVEAEKKVSYGKPRNLEYRRRYARCVLALDLMNGEIVKYQRAIEAYCVEITNSSPIKLVLPEKTREKCFDEASVLVSTSNRTPIGTLVYSPKIVELVKQLASLLLQIRAMSITTATPHELTSLRDTVKEIKTSLVGRNLQLFQNAIEIPMNRILAGMCVRRSAKP